MTTINITADQLDSNQLEAIKAFLKALKIKFELVNDKPYDKTFVEKIKHSKKEIKEGKGKSMSVSDFKKLCK